MHSHPSLNLGNSNSNLYNSNSISHNIQSTENLHAFGLLKIISQFFVVETDKREFMYLT